MNPFDIENATELLAVAWLWLRISGIFLTAWLIASTPAALLWAAGNRVLTKAARFCYRQFRALLGATLALPERIELILSRLADTKYQFVFAENEKRIRRDFSRIRLDVKNKIGAIEAMNRRLKQNYSGLDREVERYVAVAESPPMYGEVLDQIDPDLAKSSSVQVSMWVMVLFSIALVVLNTFIVNGFFEGIISYRLPVIDVQLSIAIALFYSSMEFGSGFLLAYFLQQESDQKGFIRASWFIVIAILIIVVFEVGMYSVVSGEMQIESLEPLYEVYPLTQYWFGLFGLIIGILIPLFGYGFEHARHQVAEADTYRRLKKSIADANKLVRRLPEHHERIAMAAQQARDMLAEFQRHVGTGEPPLVSGQINESIRQLEALSNEAAEARRNPYADMNEAESRLRRNFPLAMAVIFLAASTALFFVIVFATESTFGATISSLIALGWLGVSVVAGRFLFGYVTISTQSKTGPDRVVSHALPGVLQFASAFAVLALLGFSLASSNLATEFSWITFMAIVSFTSGIVLLGHLVDSVVEGTKAIGTIVFVTAIAGLQLIGAVIMFLVAMTARFLGGVFLVVGYPVLMIWRMLSASRSQAAGEKSEQPV